MWRRARAATRAATSSPLYSRLPRILASSYSTTPELYPWTGHVSKPPMLSVDACQIIGLPSYFLCDLERFKGIHDDLACSTGVWCATCRMLGEVAVSSW